MERSELGFNAWILVGNALTTLLRGSQAQLIANDASLRQRLAGFDQALSPLAPESMLDALEQLSPDDRTLLHDLCEQCFLRLGPEAETVLGLDAQTASPVLRWLEDPQS